MDALAESLLVKVLLHGVHDGANLSGHDVAILAPVEHVEEALVLLDLGAINFGKDFFNVLRHFCCSRLAGLVGIELFWALVPGGRVSGLANVWATGGAISRKAAAAAFPSNLCPSSMGQGVPGPD